MRAATTTRKSTSLLRQPRADSLSYRRVFLALALFNLERYDEAEENYKKAIEGAPSQTLARQVRTELHEARPTADPRGLGQGLASFYEKRQRWGDYACSLLELMQLFKDA